MQQIPWFSRKFDFSNKQNIFPAILERLTDTPLRLQHKLAGLSSMILTTKVGGQWSIQENLGHLIDLEPLWQGRVTDIVLQQE